jgi:hypothetical protein
MSIMQRLYDSEINTTVSSFYDDGSYVKLGDEMNGFRAEGRCAPGLTSSSGSPPWRAFTTPPALLPGGMTDRLPTAKSMLPQSLLCVLVWCKACHHQAPANLQAIIDGGRGDVPLRSLRFRCASCGSRLTDHVMMGRDALRVTPWCSGGQGGCA